MMMDGDDGDGGRDDDDADADDDDMYDDDDDADDGADDGGDAEMLMITMVTAQVKQERVSVQGH